MCLVFRKPNHLAFEVVYQRLWVVHYNLSRKSLEIAKKFVLHRADFGSLYIVIVKELGDEKNMNVVVLGV